MIRKLIALLCLLTVVEARAQQSIDSSLMNLGIAPEPAAYLGNVIPYGYDAYPTPGYTQDLNFASGAAPRLIPYVPTLAATPVAGTNKFNIGLNVVPTAAASTAGLLPTPIAAGQEVIVVNPMANAVRIKAGGTNTINGSAAGAYIGSAAASITRCESLSTSAWQCGSLAVPTPAGP